MTSPINGKENLINFCANGLGKGHATHILLQDADNCSP